MSELSIVQEIGDNEPKNRPILQKSPRTITDNINIADVEIKSDGIHMFQIPPAPIQASPKYDDSGVEEREVR